MLSLIISISVWKQISIICFYITPCFTSDCQKNNKDMLIGSAHGRQPEPRWFTLVIKPNNCASLKGCATSCTFITCHSTEAYTELFLWFVNMLWGKYLFGLNNIYGGIIFVILWNTCNQKDDAVFRDGLRGGQRGNCPGPSAPRGPRDDIYLF